MPIDNISDTALWVARYRAMETERSDAIFHDPFARILAGTRGEEIVKAMPRGRQMAWAMIVRTAVFDTLILARVKAGADVVLNLAAGLDTRPWRLALPKALRWVDVDLPEMLEYKTNMLRGQVPICQYESVPMDLRDTAARAALFRRIGGDSPHVLVVTEGLLIYLSADQVGSLARDLQRVPSFHWWLLDLANPTLLRMMTRMWGKAVRAGNAPFQFAPPEGTTFFRPFGWREVEFHSSIEEARRLRREMHLMWLWRLLLRLSSRRKREEVRRMSGIVLLERSEDQ
ncbi:MAG: class I SAM-dependent methyltransferase [Gemmatimonadaceae bacterium]